jgi:nucleoside-diphosphate-sugar epimerase
MYCDSTKARERLGWAPEHDLRAGLKKTIEWYQAELDDTASSSSFET